MEKIRLDLNELKVESFVTSDLESSGEGTVFAMGGTVCHTTCAEWHGETCDQAVGGGLGCASLECHYTNPQLASCTGPYDPTEYGCDTGDCPTDHICSEEATECCGPTD